MNVEQIFQQVMDEVCKDPLRRFAELVAADEREACAKVAETECCKCADAAAAIRARGE